MLCAWKPWHLSPLMKCRSPVSPTSPMYLPLLIHPQPAGWSAASLAAKHIARSSSISLVRDTAPVLQLPQAQSPDSLHTLAQQPRHNLDSNLLGRTSLWFTDILFSTELYCYCNCTRRCQPPTAREILLLSTARLTCSYTPPSSGQTTGRFQLDSCVVATLVFLLTTDSSHVAHYI